jgi:DNA-binding CsgD family transcriptional regulator
MLFTHKEFNSNISLYNIIDKLPAMIYLTDINANFIQANQITANWSGYKKTNQIEGITYYDMRCKAAEHADYFIQQTTKVIETKKPLKIVACYCYANEDWKVLLGEKSPIINEDNQVIGCVSNFQEITNCNLNNLSMALLKADGINSLSSKRSQANYIVDEVYTDIKLTNRESECLFFVLRGKSAKEIAYILNISIKTVEGYIAQIKIKLNCYSKSSLIEKAISQGLMSIIPSSILSKNLLKNI